MKKLLPFIILNLLFQIYISPVQAQITFEKAAWNDILAKAKKENKLVFLDAYATWCGPCKWMAANVFTNDTVADFYNRHFINAKIDMEKGEGLELAKKFNIRAYPSLLYINGDGEVMHRICGARSTKVFIEEGLHAFNPYDNLNSYVSRYNKGDRSSEFLTDYLKKADKSCMSIKEPLAEYFKTQKLEDLVSQQNWEIIYNYLNDPASAEFDYLIKNKDKFINQYGAEIVNEKIGSLFSNLLKQSARQSNKEGKDDKLKEAKAKVSASGWDKSNQAIFNTDLYYTSLKKDWKNYAKIAQEGVEKYFNNDSEKLNSISWTYFENVEDKKALQQALIWAKRSIELEEGPANTDTYAALLYKLNKKEEAIKAQEKAIELAKKNGEPTESYEEVLEKYKAGK